MAMVAGQSLYMDNIPQLISVIIPTFNRAERGCRCVRSVLDTKWPSLEVIVVDDCSPDDTATKIKEKFGEAVKYIRNAKNSFQAVSRNNGAKIATGDFLFFLDDDNIVDKDIFSEVAKAFEENPKLGLVAPMAVHMRPGKENIISFELRADGFHFTFIIFLCSIRLETAHERVCECLFCESDL